MVQALGRHARQSGTVAVGLPLGTLIHDGPATPEQISLYLPVTGSLAQTATATTRYKRTADSIWRIGHPLYRIRTTFSSAPPVGTFDDAFSWPIIGGAPGNVDEIFAGTSYDIEVTVTSGGVSVVKTLTHTTRALPGVAPTPNKFITPGMTNAQIQTILNGLVPGDVLLIENDTYVISGLVLDSSGTEEEPIHIIGASRAGSIFNNATGRLLHIFDGNYVVWENMTMVGSGVDAGVTPASTGVEFWDGAVGQTQVTFRNFTLTGFDVGIVANETIKQFLCYDSTLTGNNTWTKETTPGTPDIDVSGLTWNDDNFRLPGLGNCAFQNTIGGFGDSMSYCRQDYTQAIGGHFYRNDVLMGGDDGVEVDHGQRNLTFYDNRLRNIMTFFSLDPLHGGPLLVTRNIALNIGRTPFKWNSMQSGQFVYNNTVLSTVHKSDTVAGWHQPANGSQCAYGFENNLVIYRGAAPRLMFLDQPSGHDPIDWTHNAWYPDDNIQILGTDHANLAAALAGQSTSTPIFSGVTKRFTSDVITVSNPWTDTITLGADYHTELTTAYVPTLSGGDAAKNSGVAIPGVTDGFSGAAPDRGAIIEGRTVPTYGDTSGAWTPPYSLPSAGEALFIGTNNVHSVRPATHSAGNWLSTLFVQYGIGCFVSEYSAGGAYVAAGTGGHDGPSNSGALIFDFADALFKFRSCTNSGFTERDNTGAPSDWDISETSGDPYREITGTSVPSPTHPYATSIGIDVGTNGSYLYLTRGSTCSGSGASSGVHAFDLSSGLWSRFTNNTAPILTDTSQVILDAANNRAFLFTKEFHNYTTLHYLNLSTGAFATLGSYSFPSGALASSGYSFDVANGLFVSHAFGAGTLRALDLANISGGWAAVTVTGTLPNNATDYWCYYPPDGKFYRVPIGGGNTIGRLVMTSPTAATYDTITLTGDTIRAFADGSTIVDTPYRALMYVPSIEYLAFLSCHPDAITNNEQMAIFKPT